MATTQTGVTLEEFLALPEAEPELEYLCGKVTQKVPPKLRHSAMQYALAERFNRFGRPRRLALAFPELRTTFAEHRWCRTWQSSSGNTSP